MNALTPHDYEDDGSAGLSCARCPMPQAHRIHQSATPPPAEVRAPVRASAPLTSHLAAAVATPRLGTFRAALLLAIAERPGTDDELEVRLNRTHQSLSAARNGLMNDLLIEPLRDERGDDVTRLTRQGNRAIVWQATPAALAWAQTQGSTS